MMASGNERYKQLTLEYLFDSQKCYPILDALTSSLSLADCLVLCQVSRAFQQFSEFLRRRHLNIDLHLEDFVSKPKLFRSQLGKHRALIAGVFALRFFELSRSKAPCLDVFIESGFHEKEFQKSTSRRRLYSASSRQPRRGGGECIFPLICHTTTFRPLLTLMCRLRIV